MFVVNVIIHSKFKQMRFAVIVKFKQLFRAVFRSQNDTVIFILRNIITVIRKNIELPISVIGGEGIGEFRCFFIRNTCTKVPIKTQHGIFM